MATKRYWRCCISSSGSLRSCSWAAPFWREVWERGSRHWMLQAGQYTVTPDHRPLIGATEVEGLYVNTGYSGHGIMLSPAGGRILVEAVTSGGSAANPFVPGRAMSPVPQPTL